MGSLSLNESTRSVTHDASSFIGLDEYSHEKCCDLLISSDPTPGKSSSAHNYKQTTKWSLHFLNLISFGVNSFPTTKSVGNCTAQELVAVIVSV